MATGVDAIHSFLTRKTHGDRLIIKNNEIYLVDKGQVSFWNCLRAKFGLGGKASMKKIAKFVHDNRNNLFPQEDKDTSIENRKKFNELIKTYNLKRATFKVAKKVGKIEAETITFFGKEEWAKVGIDVKDAPPVPPNLKKIYNSPCPIWGKDGKTTIGDTHMVVLVPKMLGNQPTTINRLKKLGEKYFNNPYDFHTHDRILKEEDGHSDIKNSYWVLMTKKVIPGEQDNPLEDIIPDGYERPSLIEANVCMLSQYLRGRVLTDKSTYLFRNIHIICSQKNINGTHAVIGHCDEKGLNLCFPSSYNSSGVAVLKKL